MLIDFEIWKEYKSTGYFVSNLGNVIGLRGNVLKFDINNRGYNRVQICVNGEVKKRFVHRMVWQTFKGFIPEGMIVDHKVEGNKRNNRLSNLQLLTHSANTSKNWQHRKQAA